MITTQDTTDAIERVTTAKFRRDAAEKEYRASLKELEDATKTLECCTRLRR